MWQNEYIYAWYAKWVESLKGKRNMATLTPQFKKKHSLWARRIGKNGQVYANFSWDPLSIKHHMQEKNDERLANVILYIQRDFVVGKVITWVSFTQTNSVKITEGKFDLKLIPEFDSSASGPSVVEWIEKADLICKMGQVKHPEHSPLKADSWWICCLTAAERKLGGIYVTSAGTVSFPYLDWTLCTAITINEPDFHVEYDHNKKIWVVLEVVWWQDAICAEELDSLISDTKANQEKVYSWGMKLNG